MPESKYPYVGKHGKCNLKSILPTKQVKFGDQIGVTPGSVSALLAATRLSVVTATVDANCAEFKYYKKGILNAKSCNQGATDSVNVVGFGPGFFIVRTSRGTGYGEKGYVRLSLQDEANGGLRNGTCSILEAPVYYKESF